MQWAVGAPARPSLDALSQAAPLLAPPQDAAQVEANQDVHSPLLVVLFIVPRSNLKKKRKKKDKPCIYKYIYIYF